MCSTSSADTIDQPDAKAALDGWGFAWRSHPLFAVFTIGVGVFTDSFLFDVIVPILPFLLGDNLGLPPEQHQFYVSQILSTFGLANVAFSPLAGILADNMSSRQRPFLIGLALQTVATTLLFTARTIFLLTLSRILQGASAALVWTVGLAWCRDVVGVENMGKTTGTIFSFVSVGSIIAPVIGGALYSKGGSNAVAALSLGLLGVDFAMRLLVVEEGGKGVPAAPSARTTTRSDEASGAEPYEEATPLLSGDTDTVHSGSDPYLIPDYQLWIIRQIPVLCCFRSASLWVVHFMIFSQGLISAAFAATIPLHARKLYGFDALRSGFLFGPMGVANLIVGPLAGYGVDRFGTRLISVIGYVWLVPAIALLRLPTAEPYTQQIAFLCVLLVLIGAGIGFINSPPIVESAAVAQRYHDSNPDFFGPNGPNATLYELGNLVFCFGLFVGPIWAGGLRIRIGYGNMNACLAALAAVTALLCWIWLPPRIKKTRINTIQVNN